MKKLILSIGILVQAYSLSAQSSADSTFAKEAAQAGMLEVKLGELAASKASSEQVKMLGHHMVTDHTKAGNELKALASKKKMNLPQSLSKEGQASYDKLSKKTGADFDKAYSEMMVKDHEKVIAKFKTESASGKDSDLKSWATKTLPTLEHHLDMAKETHKAVTK